MKKITLLFIATILVGVADVYAMVYEPGPYVGGQIGWGRVEPGDGYKKYVKTTESSTANGISGRGYLGYNFTRFFSIESGYAYYHIDSYSGTEGSVDIKTYTIDLVAKIILPLGAIAKPFSHLSIYGKGGGAYSYTNVDVNMNAASTRGPSLAKSKATIVPAYGAGVIYSFNDNVAVDASWMGVLGTKRADSIGDVATNNPAALCNLFTIGLSYKITGIW